MQGLDSTHIPPSPRNGMEGGKAGSRLGSVARKVEAFFVVYRDHVAWVHALMFLCFLALLAVPPFLPDPPENATPISHFTEFANYVMW
ncbi:MAG TPA: hypothetical protein HPP75_10065, partial [Rhodospirillaceae bacterium]|nr:hypothetical protein [Rhodospirillaceae bacterium]